MVYDYCEWKISLLWKLKENLKFVNRGGYWLLVFSYVLLMLFIIKYRIVNNVIFNN